MDGLELCSEKEGQLNDWMSRLKQGFLRLMKNIWGNGTNNDKNVCIRIGKAVLTQKAKYGS